jgi:8-amino-7-oxononanoate synthase
MSLDARLAQRAEALRGAALYRRRRTLERADGEIRVDGRPVITFCSNDYLGLADHPRVTEAFKLGADRYGVGSTAAHLVCGYTRAHQALEESLAEFLGRPRALLFSCGYMANLGVVATLSDRHGQVLEDRLNHASLLDAARLAGARLRRYAHADADALAARLEDGDAGDLLAASDGVFSMDGDLAPLPALCRVARDARAIFVLDDAHGIGVLGARGRGSLEHHGVDQEDVPVLVGTLGKAIGTFGAFVAGSDALIEALIQYARTYIYTTAPPPAIAEASRVALGLLDEEAWRREALHALIRQFRSGAQALGLTLLPSSTPIQPLLVGDAARAVEASEALLARGLLVAAIRSPTVPAGSARLRISLSARHEPAQIDQLLDALGAIAHLCVPERGHPVD